MKLHYRQIILLAMIVAVLLGGWLLLLRPRGRAEARMRAEVERKERLLSDLSAVRPVAMKNLSEDIGLLEGIVTVRKARLPDSEKLDEVIDRLSELANACDVRVRRTQTYARPPSGETDLGKDFVEQRLSVEMEGDFPNFYKFLRALEDENRIIRVQELELKRRSNEPSDSRIQATLQLRIFCRKTEAQT